MGIQVELTGGSNGQDDDEEDVDDVGDDDDDDDDGKGDGVQHPIHDLDGAAELFALLASGNPIAHFF